MRLYTITIVASVTFPHDVSPALAADLAQESFAELLNDQSFTATGPGGRAGVRAVLVRSVEPITPDDRT